jgi:hypothetical protein
VNDDVLVQFGVAGLFEVVAANVPFRYRFRLLPFQVSLTWTVTPWPNSVSSVPAGT